MSEEQLKIKIDLLSDQTQQQQSIKNDNAAAPSAASQDFDTTIKDVWREEFLVELANVSNLVLDHGYTILTFDTEFAGFADRKFEDFYQQLRLNIQQLKLIQLGITLADSKGNIPKPVSTWQFNFEFDQMKDESKANSIAILEQAGIDFDKHSKQGIPARLFAEYFTTSGLFMNDSLMWVAFNSAYDFGYMLNLVQQSPLPSTLTQFYKQLGQIFPKLYDVKHLRIGQGCLSSQLTAENIVRKGIAHQAGSDSHSTFQLFYLCMKSISNLESPHLKNQIHNLLQDDSPKTRHQKNSQLYGSSNICKNQADIEYIRDMLLDAGSSLYQDIQSSSGAQTVADYSSNGTNVRGDVSSSLECQSQTSSNYNYQKNSLHQQTQQFNGMNLMSYSPPLQQTPSQIPVLQHFNSGGQMAALASHQLSLPSFSPTVLQHLPTQQLTLSPPTVKLNQFKYVPKHLNHQQSQMQQSSGIQYDGQGNNQYQQLQQIVNSHSISNNTYYAQQQSLASPTVMNGHQTSPGAAAASGNYWNQAWQHM